MNNPQDSLDALNSKIENLEAKIDKIQGQYDRLINYLIKPSEHQATTNRATVIHTTENMTSAAEQRTVFPKAADVAKAPTQNGNLKKDRDGATYLLPIVAVVCFVLAGVFLVKLAIDSGWLTHERQWGLLGILGITLVGLGSFFTKIEQADRSYLSAAGVIILYIAAYSSNLYFKMFSHEVALVLAMSVTVICLSLFRYHKSDLFAVITSIGTYLSPLLLGSKGELVFNSEFFIIWSFLFSYLASYLKTRTLSLTAAYLGMGVFTLLYSDTVDVESLYWIVSVIVLQFFTFAYGVYYYSLRNRSVLAQKEALAYLPILLFFYGIVYYFLDKIDARIAPWISLAFAGFVYLLYLRVKNQLQNLNSQLLVHGFLGVVLFHSGYLQILPEASKPWLLPLLLLLTFIADKKDYFPKTSNVLKIVFGAIGFLEFGKICFKLLDSNSLTDVFPALVTIALGAFYYLKGSQRIKNKEELFLGLVHLLSVLALYRLLADSGSFAVSAGWGIYAGIILAVGFYKKDPALAKSSLLVLLVTSLKALIYDASQSPSGVRILSLLLTGAVLYLSGIFLKKIKTWPNSKTVA